MRRVCSVAVLVAFVVAAPVMFGQSEPNNLSGKWLAVGDLYGTSVYWKLELTQTGDKLTGVYSGNKLEGTVSGDTLHFLAKDEQGDTAECKAKITRGPDQHPTISGTVTFIDVGNEAHPETHPITATLVPARRNGPPQRHEFVPTTFYRQFSALNKPVLTVWPGDTIHTTTVDAGGTDEKGVTRVLGGNPETGPFYVETASPGDTLVVHITRLRLNRDYAISDDAIVPRGQTTDLAQKMKDAKDVRWHLDLEHGMASPEKPAEHLKSYAVPVRPMLGCVAAAPTKQLKILISTLILWLSAQSIQCIPFGKNRRHSGANSFSRRS